MLIFLVLLGVLGSGLLVEQEAAYFENFQKERAMRSQQAVEQARQAMLDYMLLRAESELDIAAGSVPVKPRWLMLPCPDNVGGDKNLDGSQEGVCGAKSSSNNVVNNILESGSRFGRLPWRTRNIKKKEKGEEKGRENSINDGINIRVRDSGNNRLWYALSRNMAPSRGEENIPLNFHRLMTRSEKLTMHNGEPHEGKWLKVVDESNNVLSNRVAAVILAPGVQKQAQLSESHLETATDLSYDAKLHASVYFESYRTNDTTEIANYDKNGVFIKAPPDKTQGFNDTLAYITLEHLADERHYFFQAYKKLMGIGEVHNAPIDDRPLDNIRTALDAYYTMFGFYPLPAKQSTPQHLNERKRHCARYHSGTDPQAATLGAGVTLTPVIPITVSAAAASTPSLTVTVPGSAGFLLQHNATVGNTSPATIVYNDTAQTATLLTLARYARVSLADAVLVAAAGDLQMVSSTEYLLSAAVTVVLQSASAITVMPETHLQVSGDVIGWLAGHTLSLQRAGNDGSEFIIPAAARAMFLSTTRLTNTATTVTLAGYDVLTIKAGSTVQLKDVQEEEDFADLLALDAEIFYQDGQSLAISAALPTPASYQRRQFMVWLLTDAFKGSSPAISAPAVLFPWREKITNADSRDNLHDYPPCFDPRNFYDRRFQTALEDQTMVYAVAAACTYSGDVAACGQRSGFTVSIASDARVALPQAITLTHSYTATIGNFARITLLNGVVQNTTEVSLYAPATFPVLDAGGTTLAAFRLPSDYRFIPGSPVIVTAATPVIGGTAATIEQVRALLIYSPAPLQRVGCATAGMQTSGVLATLTPPVTLANQLVPADDITNLCYWLDDEENADADGVFVIYPPETRPQVSPRNDYFVLFGGSLRIG